MSVITIAKAKRTTVDIFKVVVDHSINVLRFIPGEKVNGQVVGGNLDLATMREQELDAFKSWMQEADEIKTKNQRDGTNVPIPEPRAVLEPIWVNKGDKGVLTVFRGIRRTSAAHSFPDLKETPQGLIEAFRSTPCYLFEGLTREEMVEAANDQTVKQYQMSGVLRWIWSMADMGKGFRELAPIVWEQFENWPSPKMQQAIKKIKSMPEGIEKVLECRDALKGCLDQEILLAHRLGKRIQDAYMIKFLIMDGLIDPNTKAEFKVNRDLLTKLAKAVDADKAGEGWNLVDGGAAFNAILDQEAGKKPPTPTPSTRPKASVLDETLGKLQSKVGQEIALYAKDGVKNGLVETDKLFFHRELAVKRFNEAKPKFVKDGNVTVAQMVELASAIAEGNYELVEKISSALSVA